jgi:5-methylcytosine-specific restriction endonuclease McrA
VNLQEKLRHAGRAQPKPLKRVKAKKRIRAKSKRKMKLHDADKLFSQYIRTRDGWQCRICGGIESIQCGHLVSRRYRALRWNPDNAIAICAKDHVFYTHRPLEWDATIEERWPGRLALLKVQALATYVRPDYEEICDWLQAALGVRGGG